MSGKKSSTTRNANDRNQETGCGGRRGNVETQRGRVPRLKQARHEGVLSRFRNNRPFLKQEKPARGVWRAVPLHRCACMHLTACMCTMHVFLKRAKYLTADNKDTPSRGGWRTHFSGTGSHAWSPRCIPEGLMRRRRRRACEGGRGSGGEGQKTGRADFRDNAKKIIWCCFKINQAMIALFARTTSECTLAQAGRGLTGECLRLLASCWRSY